MRDFYREIVDMMNRGERFCFGMVVRTSGSTPQRPGAKAAFLPDGGVKGTLGGGCLEAESRRRGLESLDTCQSQLFDLHLDGDFGWDDGLICGGTARVFLDPQPHNNKEAMEQALEVVEKGERAVLATIIAAPQIELIGTHHVCGDGHDGNGAMPSELAEALARESEALLVKPAEVDKLLSLGAGEYEIFFQPLLPQPRLYIAGAGHIGGALCHAASWLGFDVTVVDDRPSWANEERLPDAANVVMDDINKVFHNLNTTSDSYIVIVTRGHRHDAEVLREVIHKPAAYIGMIGSRRKCKLIFDGMIDEGVATKEDLHRVHSPMGLDIGSKTVEEIAMSIAVELVKVRRTNDGRVPAGHMSAWDLLERETTSA